MYNSNLKMKKEHFDFIADRFAAYLEINPNLLTHYRAGKFARPDLVKDIQVRFSNDVMAAAVGHIWICDNLYPYLDDSHIQSALNIICPTV